MRIPSKDRVRLTVIFVFVAISLCIRIGIRLYFHSQKKKDPVEDQATFTLNGHQSKVTGVALSPDGNRIVSSGSNQVHGVVHFWDAKARRLLQSLRSHEIYSTCVAISPDGKKMASGGLRGGVLVRDLKSGKLVHSTTLGPVRRPASVAFGPNGEYLAIAAREAILWHISTNRARRFTKHGSVSGALMTPDGQYLVCNNNNLIEIFRISDKTLLRTLTGHQKRITSLAITRDGKRLVSGSEDNTVRVWDPERGKELLVLNGHGRTVTCVAVSADGQRIVSGGYDRLLRVWDGTTGKVVHALSGHNHLIECVAISADGQRIVTGSEDKTIKVWDLDK